MTALSLTVLTANQASLKNKPALQAVASAACYACCDTYPSHKVAPQSIMIDAAFLKFERGGISLGRIRRPQLRVAKNRKPPEHSFVFRRQGEASPER